LARRLQTLVRPARELGHLADPIEHGAANPVVGEGLEAYPSTWVEAVTRLEQATEAKGNQIVEIAPKRELTSKAVGEAVNHFLVLRDELGSVHARS
jgi:hypothetical protein